MRAGSSSPGCAPLGREAGEVDAAVPARDPLRRDPERAEPVVREGRRREHDVAVAVEGGQREVGAQLQPVVARAQARVGGQLGVVGAGARQPEQPARQRRGDPGRAGRAQVQQVVAAVRERLDDRRQARHADLEPGVVGHLGLGHRRQPPVDVRVRPDHLDLEAGHPALAHLLERARDAVGGADAVGDQRDAQRVAVARRELVLLAALERGRGRVRDDRDAGLEDAGGGARPVAVRAASRRLEHAPDRGLQLALVAAPGAPEEVRVR